MASVVLLLTSARSAVTLVVRGTANGGCASSAIKDRVPKSVHPNRGDLYTPITPEFLDLLERMRAECGNWRLLAAAVPMRMKVLRNLRKGKQRKAVSQSLVDKMCTTTGVGSIQEFEWFTADDMVSLGIWRPAIPIQNQEVKRSAVIARRERRKALRREQKRIARRKRWGLPLE